MTIGGDVLATGKINCFAHRLKQDWFRPIEWQWLNGASARWNFNHRVYMPEREKRDVRVRTPLSSAGLEQAGAKEKEFRCTVIKTTQISIVGRERARAIRLLWWTTSPQHEIPGNAWSIVVTLLLHAQGRSLCMARAVGIGLDLRFRYGCCSSSRENLEENGRNDTGFVGARGRMKLTYVFHSSSLQRVKKAFIIYRKR